MQSLLLKKYPEDGAAIYERLCDQAGGDQTLLKTYVLKVITQGVDVVSAGTKRKRVEGVTAETEVETIDDIHIKTRLVGSEKGQFKCGTCKSWKTEWEEKQTRSADEPGTVFIRCLNCKKRAKIAQ